MKRRGKGFAVWLLQGSSAAYMLLFFLFAIGSVSLAPLRTYAEWRNWVGAPGMSAAIFVFFAALLSHVGVGLRDVLLDYAQTAALRRLLLGVLVTALVATASWVLWILVRAQG